MTEARVYPAQLAIQPISHPLAATIRVPGSKSITNRALVLAALTKAPDGVTLDYPLESEDTEVMIDSLRKLGYGIEWRDQQRSIVVTRPMGASLIPANHADLYVANSGTTMRFLTAMVALGTGQFRLDGVPRMRERPIGDLLDALKQLGVSATSETANDCPPVVIQTDGIPGGEVAIRAGMSSQFLSGLLMAAPFARSSMSIRVAGEFVSEPYVAMTVAMMRDWGITVVTPAPGHYVVPAPQVATRSHYSIEPDASAASYFVAAAAIQGGRVTVSGFPNVSLQGDLAFVDVLEEMGCQVTKSDSAITVQGGTLRGIDLDMNAISDTVMTLGAVACFAEGPTTIRNVAHIRHKETDRISALANELRRLGAEVIERADGLTIHPRPLHGATVQTYRDHRMAMSLSLIGMRVPGVVIDDPGCVAKTYPGYWEDFAAIQNRAAN
ncbi:3-phosphoshikimate 1-carboxyvinyltransferase [Tuwongella immobilis]|uniref:3-phosphoshikimate 1-carboxyvinyltransferase n=1 Tax=Tuwongella immobilis TaxID=692036 RepID=A0A6C2YNN6_9BACT|nr:3-phosphoshikimate 1-carboxyvinyltransferase [Tuwongella immobilis]VIP02901.1 3-phosphoshikimate 1-carboxyvinyltransferase : 3-phosphoshikimate 1-carboxyvinyltransferase OS=Singulisphaera acidiphila (strain ATCC BAA-1392 / DSM 18658 / VKM B-2454 / MOB10) GN=aroA PE=3 SV=1: EPSP_synthase [Tuwongella immobilis]VTS02791.1 3-phosphoshikimate 1-carboxyvinyltransferase : 3-phosphoshikimate 1-carboxyvinyltransferase OS=Singulisphaera acidiphila (strain ATCC BAA-1392 / DSM 18658 / VKM B-2454 / MOB10) 